MKKKFIFEIVKRI